MYPVLNDFIEKEHENTLYNKGETYPKPGFKADIKRTKALQGVHKKYKVAFLGDEIKPKKASKKTDAE